LVDAIVYVVDAADRTRLEESKKVLQQQLRDPELNGNWLNLCITPPVCLLLILCFSRKDALCCRK
jgi:hypothetical protein